MVPEVVVAEVVDVELELVVGVAVVAVVTAPPVVVPALVALVAPVGVPELEVVSLVDGPATAAVEPSELDAPVEPEPPSSGEEQAPQGRANKSAAVRSKKRGVLTEFTFACSEEPPLAGAQRLVATGRWGGRRSPAANR